MILADKIIKLRKQNGWSQENLAEKLEISRQSVSKWESGTSIPDLDKIIKMSSIFGVSTDYLLKDDLEELTTAETINGYEEECGHVVSLEEANNYMEVIKKNAKPMAVATFLCIISPIILIFLCGLSGYRDSALSGNLAAGFGTAVLLMIVAVAVAIFVFCGMQLSKYEYMEKEIISLSYGVQGVVEKNKEAFEATHQKCTVSGVFLCIAGVIPLLIAAGFDARDIVYMICVDVLLVFVACGVYLFVWSGCIRGSYEKLLQIGEYTIEKKNINKKLNFFPGVYWLSVTAIYLAISFIKMNWEVSWIVWPVAGTLFAAIYGILSVVVKPKNQQ